MNVTMEIEDKVMVVALIVEKKEVGHVVEEVPQDKMYAHPTVEMAESSMMNTVMIVISRVVMVAIALALKKQD